MHPTMSRAEYQELWDHIVSLKKSTYYRFRIDIIDGVKVHVLMSNDLNYKKELYVNFEITSRYNGGTGLGCHRFDNFDEFITFMTTELPHFRYDKQAELFMKPKKRFESLIRMQNVKLDGEECCVCHDLTISKTGCKHHMCLECWSQLKKRSCPMCRKCLCCNLDESECECEF